MGKDLNSRVTLARSCEAIQIPAGHKVMLPKGRRVTITQSLGGAYTVMTEDGYMVRIEAKDADAIGKEASIQTQIQEPLKSKEDVEKAVWDQLKTCFDPEIPINIAELGLIYDCKVSSLEGEGYGVQIKMTLTAPGCGMGGTLAADVKHKVEGIPGVRESDVQLVWDPPWNPDRMSEAAKLQLGML